MTSLQEQSQKGLALPAETGPVVPFSTDSYRKAVDQLHGTFKEARPLAILIGDGRSAASTVIRSFLDGVPDDVAVARITEHVSDANAGMREILRKLGHDPNETGADDIEEAFTMSLSLQLIRRRRTIVCLEEAHDIGPWMLALVRHLVELETEGKYGLMVILSGRPSLNAMLQEPPLNTLSAEAADRIALAPVTEADTAEYIRRRVQAARQLEQDYSFTPEAMTLIHELGEGVPDAVVDLCSRCLQLAREEHTGTVTRDVVRLAAASSAPAHKTKKSGAKKKSAAVDGAKGARKRLIARMNGKIVQEHVVDQGYILIGRSKMCDVCLASGTVSSHHALVVNSSTHVDLIDLRSTNGTFVGKRPIKQYPLRDSDVIQVGDYMIEYVAGDNLQA